MTRAIRNPKRTSVAALLLIFFCGWTAPSHALLGLLPGSLIVRITEPAAGSTLSGTTTVRASVSVIGALTVSGVQFKLDGANLGAEDRSAPYSVSWDTRTSGNGTHTLTAVARDILGIRYTSEPVTVSVANAPPPDTTPPSVSISAPASGSTVSGTISVTADASDNVGVAAVLFFLDGEALGSEDTSIPYSVPWDTTTTANGTHTLTARARDAVGNLATSAPVTVTVSNGPPPDTTPPGVTITSPASGASVSGSITVTADASDNVGVAGVQFFADGTPLGAEDTTAPYAVAWDTTTVADGSHTLTARARDAAGNSATSAAVMVTVSNGAPPDTTPPGVTITSPASGATVSGTVTVTASATDNVGVAGVRFLADGTAVGAEDTTAPYSAPWDTTAVANGSHTLTAIARDAAGNSTTSSAVTVTVSNSAPPPDEVTRVEETDVSISYTAGWTAGDTSFAWSGGTATYARGPAARATFSFSGTRVSWIGWREARGGIARVFLDGVQVTEVDLYAATAAISVPVFTSAVLASGSHTLEIEVTGTKNAAAGDTIVIVDAFDVTGSGSTPPPPPPPPPPPGSATRVQETDPSVSYAGTWYPESTMGWSGGTAVYAVGDGHTATFTFTGTGVTWIAYRGHYGGIVRVYLDGAQVAEIDTYATTEQVSVPVYSATGLTAGTHTLRIELTGMKNPASDASETAVDAFDVTP